MSKIHVKVLKEAKFNITVKGYYYICIALNRVMVDTSNLEEIKAINDIKDCIEYSLGRNKYGSNHTATSWLRARMTPEETMALTPEDGKNYRLLLCDKLIEFWKDRP